MTQDQNINIPSAEERRDRHLWRYEKINILADRFRTKSRIHLIVQADGLSLTPQAIDICRSFSYNAKISADEIFLCDSYLSALKTELGAHTLSELYTDDKYIAETFADMMASYSRLYPDYTAPCSVLKMAELAHEVISNSKPRTFSLTDISVFSGADTSHLELLGYTPLVNSADTMVSKRTDAPSVGDPTKKHRLLLIYSKENDKEKLASFFAEKKAFGRGFSLISGSPCHIFRSLLHSFPGLTVNASLLPAFEGTDGTQRSLMSTAEVFFTENYLGNNVYAVFVRSAQVSEVTAAAKREGLSVMTALQPWKKKEVFITSRETASIKFSAELLRMLDRSICSVARLPETKSIADREIELSKIYDDGKNAVYSTAVSLVDSPSPYHEVIRATSLLVLSALKDGFNMNNSTTCLSVSAKLDVSTPESLGETVCAVCGLYKAETELALATENCLYEASSEQKITLSLRTYAEKERIPLDGSTDINSILSAELDENGIPNFDLIRKFRRGECLPERISAEKELNFPF